MNDWDGYYSAFGKLAVAATTLFLLLAGGGCILVGYAIARFGGW